MSRYSVTMLTHEERLLGGLKPIYRGCLMAGFTERPRSNSKSCETLMASNQSINLMAGLRLETPQLDRSINKYGKGFLSYPIAFLLYQVAPRKP